jgi:uncharacterized protein (TIRG00374 family)
MRAVATEKAWRKWLVIAVKLLVAVGIYAFILWQLTKPDASKPAGYDPWRTLAEGFASPWCWAGVLLYGIPMLGMSLRWMILMRSEGMHISYGKATGYFFIGQFFNNFALGSVGGDAVRAWYVAKDFPDRKGPAILAVLMDRVIGMGALGINAVIGVAVGLAMGLPSAGKVAWVVFAVMGLICMVLLMVFCRPLQRAMHLGRLADRLPGQKFIAHARDALAMYHDKHRVLVWMILLSILDQWLGIVCVCLMGIGFNVSYDFLLYLLFVPLAWMISSIPVTPGGAGMQEGALYVLFRDAGCDPVHTTGMALMNRVMLIFWGLPGAVLYLLTSRRPRREEVADAIEGAEASSAAPSAAQPKART